MGLVKYFWDSFAVIEIVKGNLNYSNYKDEEIIFTIFNLVEIYLSVLRDFGKEFADKVYQEYFSAVVEVKENVLKEAMVFKLQNKSKNLSYADAIGYIHAKRNNMIFLTGDKEFKDLDKVEFVNKD